jgi:hypothetical protein
MANTNWIKPDVLTNIEDVWDDQQDKLDALVKQDVSGFSNIPTGAIRWSASNKRFEKWSGSAWAALESGEWNIDAKYLNGSSSSAFAPSAHVGANGSAHAIATTSVNGFMSSADKQKLDNAATGTTASTLALRDTGGRVGVGTPTQSFQATPKSYVDGLDDENVKKAGTQTITGTKTFSALPLLTATPSSDNHAARKKYVDDQINSAIGGKLYAGRVNSTGSAIKLPSGWASSFASSTYRVTHNFGDLNYTVNITSQSVGGASTISVSQMIQSSNYFEVTFYEADNNNLVVPKQFHFIVIKD